MSVDEQVREAVARLPAVTLEEVLRAAELQTRVDRKYIVSRELFADVLAQMSGRISVLEIAERRAFRYESVYFDTPQLTAYRQHAHGRRRRVKIRTRSYLDSGECLLEFKHAGARGETMKERHPYEFESRHDLDDTARELAERTVGERIPAGDLRPVLTVSYQRVTLVDPARGTRVTCDLDLSFEDVRGRSHGPLAGSVVVESKTLGCDSDVDRVLRASGRRPLSLSKYCVGMAVLDPTLPANRWNRELRTYFDWQPQRG